LQVLIGVMCRAFLGGANSKNQVHLLLMLHIWLTNFIRHNELNIPIVNSAELYQSIRTMPKKIGRHHEKHLFKDYDVEQKDKIRGCKRDNTIHTCLFFYYFCDYFWGNIPKIFLEYSWKSFWNNLLEFIF